MLLLLQVIRGLNKQLIRRILSFKNLFRGVQRMVSIGEPQETFLQQKFLTWICRELGGEFAI